MHNKYCETISKIKIDEQFKEKLILNLEQESKEIKAEANGTKYQKKEGIVIKIKRIVIAVISTLAVLISGGAVYATYHLMTQ